jgi:hypothetical protein
VSDATNPGGAGGDFRGSREEKRQDETVMINSENLSDLVSQAKSTPAADAGGAPAPVEAKTGPNLVIVTIGVVIVLAIVIALVVKAIG